MHMVNLQLRDSDCDWKAAGALSVMTARDLRGKVMGSASRIGAGQGREKTAAHVVCSEAETQRISAQHTFENTQRFCASVHRVHWHPATPPRISLSSGASRAQAHCRQRLTSISPSMLHAQPASVWERDLSLPRRVPPGIAIIFKLIR